MKTDETQVDQRYEDVEIKLVYHHILTGIAPLGAVSHRFDLMLKLILPYYHFP